MTGYFTQVIFIPSIPLPLYNTLNQCIASTPEEARVGESGAAGGSFRPPDWMEAERSTPIWRRVMFTYAEWGQPYCRLTINEVPTGSSSGHPDWRQRVKTVYALHSSAGYRQQQTRWTTFSHSVPSCATLGGKVTAAFVSAGR